MQSCQYMHTFQDAHVRSLTLEKRLLMWKPLVADTNVIFLLDIGSETQEKSCIRQRTLVRTYNLFVVCLPGQAPTAQGAQQPICHGKLCPAHNLEGSPCLPVTR